MALVLTLNDIKRFAEQGLRGCRRRTPPRTPVV